MPGSVELCMKKSQSMSSNFATKQISMQPVELQKIARILKCAK